MSSDRIAARFFAALEPAFDAHRPNQQALAKRWGVSQPLVSNWLKMVRGEIRQSVPGVATLLRVCAAEGINPVWVLWGEPTVSGEETGASGSVEAAAVRKKRAAQPPGPTRQRDGTG